ncbi:MAG: hypothetical protein ACLP51_08605 [Syntrophobacteraceae bacterium]
MGQSQNEPGTEEIRRKMAIRMAAVFKARMFLSTGLKPRTLEILSPTVEKKC